MKYVKTSDYSVEHVEMAELMFERYLGYSMASTEFEETVRATSIGFPIRHTPVIDIISVFAKTSKAELFDYSKFFGSTDWIELDKKDIILHIKDDKASLSVPPSVFGTAYEEIKIKYTSGIVDIPVEIQNAILEIAELIKNGKVDEWHCFLPYEILDVIEKYRKEAE